MGGWDLKCFNLAVPSFCTHEDFRVRSTALHVLLRWLDLVRAGWVPAERIEGYDEHSFDDTLKDALALGVAENTEFLARKHLARTG